MSTDQPFEGNETGRPQRRPCLARALRSTLNFVRILVEGIIALLILTARNGNATSGLVAALEVLAEVCAIAVAALLVVEWILLRGKQGRND